MMRTIDKINNFIENIKAATVGKKATITATFKEDKQVSYICSIDDKIVDSLCISEGERSSYLNKIFEIWAKHPRFISPNLKSFETYSER